MGADRVDEETLLLDEGQVPAVREVPQPTFR
jgi:hypothetical protein